METLRQEFDHLAQELVEYKNKEAAAAGNQPAHMHDTFGAEQISPKKAPGGPGA